MAAIYDKALKRKDFSGIVNKDKKADEAKAEPVANGVETKESKRGSLPKIFTGKNAFISKISGKSKAKKKEDKEKAAKADDPKAGADTGKIVNLMAGDANRVRFRRIFSSKT